MTSYTIKPSRMWRNKKNKCSRWGHSWKIVSDKYGDKRICRYCRKTKDIKNMKLFEKTFRLFRKLRGSGEGKTQPQKKEIKRMKYYKNLFGQPKQHITRDEFLQLIEAEGIKITEFEAMERKYKKMKFRTNYGFLYGGP